MVIEAECTFNVTAWDEKPYQEFEGGAKLTRAKVSLAYQGTLQGEANVEYLMSYTAKGTASFVGMELIKGLLSGKSGSFVIQHVGTYGSDGARSAWVIVAGSGTGELADVTGKGSYVATSESVPVFFCYELPN